MAEIEVAKLVESKTSVTKLPEGEQLESLDFWWNQGVKGPIFEDSEQVPKDLKSLYISSLTHSPQVKVFSDLPLIRQTSILEAQGRFDVIGFIESKWEKSATPVNRTGLVETGRSNYHEEVYSTEGGFRKRFDTGAEATLSQRFSHYQDNSTTLVPNSQMEGVLTLSVIQPLLRGSGREYNNSIIKIANIDKNVSELEFQRQLMSHLSEVNRAYWSLYVSRAEYTIIKKLYLDTTELVNKLRERQDLDSRKSELLTAEASLSRREALMIRSEASIKNIESRLRVLVNSPDLKSASRLEIIPRQAPLFDDLKSDVKEVMLIAMKNRPEILQAFEQLKSLDIRKDMSKNELLPQLNLIAETSLNGLDDGDDWQGSFEDEQSNNSWLLGVSYELPIQNREAKARYIRRNLEYRQQLSQINATIDTVLFEVKVAYRELETAHREVQAKHRSLKAADDDQKAMSDRWDVSNFRGEKGGATYLQFLLDSQVRYSRAAEECMKALVTYNIALENLERVQGTLLSYHHFEKTNSVDNITQLPKYGYEYKPGLMETVMQKLMKEMMQITIEMSQ